MNTPELEHLFIKLFQNEITISHKGKELRKGRLILFSIKDFYLNFKLSCNNRFQVYELPFPFDVKVKGDEILFSYRLNDFTKKYKINPVEQALYFYSKPSKFFDSELIIKKT